MAKKHSVRQLTAAEAAMPASDLSAENMSVLPEKSGSPDKDTAVAAETAAPQVKTVTPEGADWLNKDPFGLKRVGLYGKKDRFALRYEELQRHAQFRGAPMGPADLEVLHGADEPAPVTRINILGPSFVEGFEFFKQFCGI